MVRRSYPCPRCEERNELPEFGAASVVEVACWQCDLVFEVNQFKRQVLSP